MFRLQLARADEHQPCLRHARQARRKDPQQPPVVLLRTHPPDMPDHRRIPQAVRPAHLCAQRLLIAKALHVDRVGDQPSPLPPQALAEEEHAAVRPAGAQLGRRQRQQRLAGHLERPLVIGEKARVVRMRDAHRQARALRAAERIEGHALVVGMERADLRVLPQQPRHEGHVGRVLCRAQARRNEDASAERTDLPVVIAGLFPVHQEVELNPVAVHVPVVVHQHRLNSGAVHIAHGMQNVQHVHPPLTRRFAPESSMTAP